MHQFTGRLDLLQRDQAKAETLLQETHRTSFCYTPFATMHKEEQEIHVVRKQRKGHMQGFMTKKKQASILRILLLLAIPLSIALIVVQYQPGLLGKVGLGPAKASNGSTVPRYEKFELTYPYTGSYSNPNDPAQADVEAVFTTPSNKQQTVPGFFFQDFTRSGGVKKETVTQVQGSNSWKVRYAPSEIGDYTYTVTLKDAHGTTPLGSGSFTVVSSSNPGFVRAAGLHLQRDNGQPFIPLGVNTPRFQPTFTSNAPGGDDIWGDGSYGVDAMYKQFMANGANFFHLWSCNWNVGSAKPWGRPNIGCDSSSVSTPQMSEADSWLVDYIVDQGHQDNIYIIPVLKHRDFKNFTTADQIKSRYFVARWGYSTNIIAWDFAKEGAYSYPVNHAWASYMNSIDPYQHLLTTSEGDHYPAQNAGNALGYNKIFGDPLMTLVQNHDYTGDCTDDFGMDSALALFSIKLDPSGKDPRDIHHFNKPSFFGETGVHIGKGTPCQDQPRTSSPYYNKDKNGLIMKSEIWGSLMGTACGCAPWYYRFDLNGAWTQFVAFKGASAYAAALPAIPDSANLFTTYNDTRQATVSDARLRLIGRKNATFAMLFVQNTTGTWGAILRGQTPTPVAGTMNLLGMQSGATFTVQWYDTDTGAVVGTDHPSADSGGLLSLTLPSAITQNIAAIITTGATSSGKK